MDKRSRASKCIIKSVDYLQQWRNTRESVLVIQHDTLRKILGIVEPVSGLARDVLDRLGAGWYHNSLLFPMYNENLQIVGVHKRPEKKNIHGSHVGIFACADMLLTGTLFITEGVTDLICMLLAGFNAIGRQSAQSCNIIIKDFLTDTQITHIVIIADNDKVGKESADKLGLELYNGKRNVSVLVPPYGYGDVKEFVNDKGLEIVKDWIDGLLELNV